MAMGAVLPGSALLVGLATAKTKTTDTRRASFIVVHPGWRIVQSIDPNHARELNGLAAQVNVIAESIHRTASASPAAAANDETSSRPSFADEMEKLANLRDRGILTEDEFAAAKTRLLGSF